MRKTKKFLPALIFIIALSVSNHTAILAEPAADYELWSEFHNGLALARVIDDDDFWFFYGFINENREVVIPFEYYQANLFSEGLAAVSNVKDGWGFERWGYIDTNGNTVVPSIYSFACTSTRL
jgi:hypothetical protein